MELYVYEYLAPPPTWIASLTSVFQLSCRFSFVWSNKLFWNRLNFGEFNSFSCEIEEGGVRNKLDCFGLKQFEIESGIDRDNSSVRSFFTLYHAHKKRG